MEGPTPKYQQFPSKHDAAEIFKEEWCKKCPIFNTLLTAPPKAAPLCPPSLLSTCPSYAAIQEYLALFE